MSNCLTNGICYRVAVPQSSASSGKGNIYYQIRAPTSYSWVALGQGSSMAGSSIFVVYADGKGNVTVSPRAGEGHVMPQEDSSVQVKLLAGSGVHRNIMTANFMCANCQSWSGGDMSLSSTTANYIGAWLDGSALDSTDASTAISQHTDTTEWEFDLTKAVISEDANPYVHGKGSSSGDGSDDGNNNSGDNSNNSGVVGGSSEEDELAKTDLLVKGHGAVMTIVMVFLYPIGAAAMPLFRKWIIHAVWQGGSFVLMWIGFGLGYRAAVDNGDVSLLALPVPFTNR